LVGAPRASSSGVTSRTRCVVHPGFPSGGFRPKPTPKCPMLAKASPSSHVEWLQVLAWIRRRRFDAEGPRCAASGPRIGHSSANAA
jgi:hypothetical protein